MRPSTWAGTPAIIRFGAAPSRAGQLRRTRSKFPPMPPEVTTTASAANANSPAASRLVEAPRGASSSARTVPLTPVTAPPAVSIRSTRCRKANRTSPASAASRTIRANGSTSPGPVPQTMWKRGTEFPCPSAV